MSLYQLIPNMDQVLKNLVQNKSFALAPRGLLKSLVEDYLNQIRKDISTNGLSDELAVQQKVDSLAQYLTKALNYNLHPVINATGVVIHTNLGRSVLAKEAIDAMLAANSGFCSLELDAETGERGNRQNICADLLQRITGAESSVIVNNNAAAVLLILDSFCSGRTVIISRGELVEIGGKFRIPDVMRKSGAKLYEVGTTNKTHLEDYATAIKEVQAKNEQCVIIKVHTSNYRILGFHETPDFKDIAKLAKAKNIPSLFDVGSGNLLLEPLGNLPEEPAIQDLVAMGFDLISFSGDKVLGGPQAGIIVGNQSYIDTLRKNPLLRALRCGKGTLAALEATLRLYMQPELARAKIPTLRMLSLTPKDLKNAARRLMRKLQSSLDEQCEISLESSTSRVGGGAFPAYDLPTTLVCLKPVPKLGFSATDLKKALLQTNPPVLGRLENDAFCLDPRTLQAGEAETITSLLEIIFANFK